jgi:hypothetical protein
MDLPGGIMRDGQRLRDYRFKTLTGVEELAIAEAASSDANLPQRITTILAVALDTLGGEQASAAYIRALSVADRQVLMQRLIGRLGVETGWMTARCGQCAEPFDFALRFADLPVKPAGETFPLTVIGGSTFRAPTGGDQETLASEELDGETALRRLVQLCRVEGPTDFDADRLDDEALSSIDQALESVSPEAVTETALDCPSCETSTVVGLDIDAMPLPDADILYQEVHRIASVYHWSEHDILSLPRGRRQRYLALIARDLQPARAVGRLA